MAKNDGGLAFPVIADSQKQVYLDEHGSETASYEHSYRGGMSLRDWFAGQAMHGIFADGVVTIDTKRFAAGCYRLADAMLAEREK